MLPGNSSPWSIVKNENGCKITYIESIMIYTFPKFKHKPRNTISYCLTHRYRWFKAHQIMNAYYMLFYCLYLFIAHSYLFINRKKKNESFILFILNYLQNACRMDSVLCKNRISYADFPSVFSVF